MNILAAPLDLWLGSSSCSADCRMAAVATVNHRQTGFSQCVTRTALEDAHHANLAALATIRFIATTSACGPLARPAAPSMDRQTMPNHWLLQDCFGDGAGAENCQLAFIELAILQISMSKSDS